MQAVNLLEPHCVDKLNAKNTKRPGNTPTCIEKRMFEPAGGRPASQVLVVFVGGNDRSKTGISLGPAVAFELSKRLNASIVTFHKSESGASPDLSSGNGSPENGLYSAQDVAMVASELSRLRSLNVGKKILLIAYSAGAAMAAQLSGRFPGSANAYLLVSCPCNRAHWQPWRRAQADTRISLLVGTNDDNTPASLSETYVAALRAQGVKTRLTYAVGATHVSVLRSPEFFMLAEQLAGALAF